jgi:hypothetical protein
MQSQNKFSHIKICPIEMILTNIYFSISNYYTSKSPNFLQNLLESFPIWTIMEIGEI